MKSNWEGIAKGARVKCSNPEDFKAEVARKLRDREGSVVRFQVFSGAPIIEFPQVGRRKAFTWVPPGRRYVVLLDTTESEGGAA